MKNLYIALVSALLFSGCSITPRYHSFGYNVEWKIRNTTRAKLSTSPISAESQKQSQFNRTEITRDEHCNETAKTMSFKEEKRLLIDTMRKTEFSIPERIALDTAEKSVKKKIMDRKIKVTNALLMGDLISMPLVLGLTNGEDFIGIIYVLLVAFPLLIILLIARIIQGIRRRRLKNKDAIHGQGNQTQSSYTAEKYFRIENQEPGPTVVRDGHKLANWAYALSIIGVLGTPLLTPLYLTPISIVLSIIAFRQLEKNNKFFKRAKRSIGWNIAGLLIATVIILLLTGIIWVY